MISSQGVLSRAAQISSINALAALLENSAVELYQDNITPTRDTLLSALTTATYDGYASVTVIAWGDPGFDPDGIAYVTSGVCSFRMTGTTTPNLIYGAFVRVGYAPAQPFLAGLFTSQVTMAKVADACNCIIKLRGDGQVFLELLSAMQS